MSRKFGISSPIGRAKIVDKVCESEAVLVNPLNAELNPICHLLALFIAHHIFHVSKIRVNVPYKTEAKFINFVADLVLLNILTFVMPTDLSLVRCKRV